MQLTKLLPSYAPIQRCALLFTLCGLALAHVPAYGQVLFVPDGTGSGGVGASSNGNVGVGTATPSQKLEVTGGYARIAYASGPFLDFYHTAAGADLKTTRIGSVNGALLFESVNDLYTIPLERMRIAADGTVGIGTSAPAAALHVRRAGQSELRLQSNGRQWAMLTNEGWGSNGFSVYDVTADVSRLQIDTAGNVGIGTTAPVRALTIGGNSSTEMVFQTADRPADQRNYRIYSASGGLFLGTLNDAGTAGVNHVVINQTSGNVGVGTDAPTHKLAVNGTIRAKEVIVDTGWADHVFAADYRLAPLSEVEQHILQNGHLPDVPSAADVAARGVSVGEMQKLLLQKIEELTLHAIEQSKLLESQQAEIARLRVQVSQLSPR